MFLDHRSLYHKTKHDNSRKVENQGCITTAIRHSTASLSYDFPSMMGVMKMMKTMAA